MRVLLAPEQGALRAQVSDDGVIGREDVQAGEIGNRLVERAVVANGIRPDDAVRAADGGVVFAEGWSEVNDPCAVVGRDELGWDDRERMRRPGEVRKQGTVCPPDQRFAGRLSRLAPPAQLGCEPSDGVARQPHRLPALLHRDICDAWPDCERDVRRQRPGRRRPCEERLRGIVDELQAHGDRRIHTGPERVILSGFEIRQRRLTARAEDDDLLAFIDQTPLPQALEDMDDGLHVVGIHRPIVVVEVDPAAEAIDDRPPFRGIADDHLSTALVEAVDAVVEDVRPRLEAELLLDFELDRQPVAVPAPSPWDVVSAHREVSRDDVFDVGRENVAVVRQARGKRRTVVEDVLRPALARLDGAFEGSLRLPALEDLALDLRKAHFIGNGVNSLGHGTVPDGRRRQ